MRSVHCGTRAAQDPRAENTATDTSLKSTPQFSMICTGRSYGSLPFGIWGPKEGGAPGEIGLTRDTLPFLDESFDPKKLHPDARTKLESFEETLKESTRFNRAMCRGFVDKAARMKFEDYILMPVVGVAVTIWRTKDLPEDIGRRVPGMPELSFASLRHKLVIPIITESKSWAAEDDQMAILHLANYALEEEVALPFLSSACGGKRPPCAVCGKPGIDFRTYDQFQFAQSPEAFYAYTMPQCGDNACERRYMKLRARFLAVLGPLITGHQESLPVLARCQACKVTKPTDELRKCSGCKVAIYCSSACQRRDWLRHKPVCSRKGNVIEENKKFAEELARMSMN